MYTNQYKQNELQAIPQNQLEARTLIKAASRLNNVKEKWNELAKSELIPALENNRKLWTILASELAEIDHPMDHNLRQNIANLALFIFKHTIKVMADKEAKPKDLEILITINMEVAKGLSELVPQEEISEDDGGVAEAQDTSDEVNEEVPTEEVSEPESNEDVDQDEEEDNTFYPISI